MTDAYADGLYTTIRIQYIYIYIYFEYGESKNFVDGTVNQSRQYKARLPDVLNFDERVQESPAYKYFSREKIAERFPKIDSPEIYNSRWDGIS